MHLITSTSDIYYLTGVLSHDPGEILIIWTSDDENGETVVFCDARTGALFENQGFTIVDDRKSWVHHFQNYKILCTDPDFLTQSLREKIEGFGVELVMRKSPITQKRIIKNFHEIEILRASQTMNKRVHEMILPLLIPGVTEESIARKIQILQLELGASGVSFPPIVAFGENAAIPHHNSTARELLSSDIILLDTGLVYQGYCSDMTRMITQGETSEKARNIAQLVENVTYEIIKWAKPGMTVRELDIKAREMLGDYEPYFSHSLGHGVGIDIHEAPHISYKSEEILVPGMIITIEPGIYIAGKYGARYEEMCLVGKERLEVLG